MTTDTRDVPEWFAIAEHEIGIQEVAGPGSNPRVVEYLKTTSLPASMAESDDTPWCSAFVNWCMERAGIQGTGRANARSWLTWGQPLQMPRVGAVMVFSREQAGASAGHVSLFVRDEQMPSGKTVYWCLGGNQNNRVSVNMYPAARLIGIRWPTNT